MNASDADTLIIDCGTMVGHKQQELELVKETVPFFGINPDGGSTVYLRFRLSSGLLGSFRAIYRPDNGMWRIELTSAVPEIDYIFPVVDGVRQRRSDHAAIFTRVDETAGAQYDLLIFPIDSDIYREELSKAESGGISRRTQAGSHGRNYGWY